VHRLAEVLTSADEHGEQHEHGRRVLAVQSVDQVVVEVVLEAAQIDGRLHETVHLGTGARASAAATTDQFNQLCTKHAYGTRNEI